MAKYKVDFAAVKAKAQSGPTWQQKERQALPWQSRPKTQDPQYYQPGDPQYIGANQRDGGGGVSDEENARRARINRSYPTRFYDGFTP